MSEKEWNFEIGVFAMSGYDPEMSSSYIDYEFPTKDLPESIRSKIKDCKFVQIIVRPLSEERVPVEQLLAELSNLDVGDGYTLEEAVKRVRDIRDGIG